MSHFIPLILTLLFSPTFTFHGGERTPSETLPISSIHSQATGQELFLKHADHALNIMSEAAREMSVQGVAVVVFVPQEPDGTWISKMKVAGAMTNGSANFLAVAYSKAAEMADTRQNSGNRKGDPLHGEFGYQGGVIEKVKAGYLMAVFSGATGEQDTEIAVKGLEVVRKGFAN